MSNLQLGLIVLAVFILLMVFGRSPMDEVREKRKQMASRQLIEKIEDANKKREGGGLSGFGGGLLGKSGGIGSAPQATGNYYNSGSNPFSNANPYNRPGSQKSAPDTGFPASRPPADDYYPPVSKNPLPPQSSLKKEGKTERIYPAPTRYSYARILTAEGRYVAFFDTQAYTFDHDGEPVPMPDGIHQMGNGKWSIVVRGGQRVVLN